MGGCAGTAADSTPMSHPGSPPTSRLTLSSVPLFNLSLSPLSPSPSLSELWVPLEGQGMGFPGIHYLKRFLPKSWVPQTAQAPTISSQREIIRPLSPTLPLVSQENQSSVRGGK